MSFVSNADALSVSLHYLNTKDRPSGCEEFPDLISVFDAVEDRGLSSLLAFVQDAQFKYFRKFYPERFEGLKHSWDSSPKAEEQEGINQLVQSCFHESWGVDFTHATSTHFGRKDLTIRKFTLHVPRRGTVFLVQVKHKTRADTSKRSIPQRGGSDDPQPPRKRAAPPGEEEATKRSRVECGGSNDSVGEGDNGEKHPVDEEQHESAVSPIAESRKAESAPTFDPEKFLDL
eukprot:GILI01053653.1.p1 GENE.GILI01053653.1~~GILI01053653.1.p1  ORF type:complete len:231 (+),score=39.16 GILI01053653.1:58-750(+)